MNIYALVVTDNAANIWEKEVLRYNDKTQFTALRDAMRLFATSILLVVLGFVQCIYELLMT